MMATFAGGPWSPGNALIVSAVAFGSGFAATVLHCQILAVRHRRAERHRDDR